MKGVGNSLDLRIIFGECCLLCSKMEEFERTGPNTKGLKNKSMRDEQRKQIGGYRGGGEDFLFPVLHSTSLTVHHKTYWQGKTIASLFNLKVCMTGELSGMKTQRHRQNYGWAGKQVIG